MRRVLVSLLVVLGLAVAGTASADHLDPQKRIRPADQSRARSMILRLADLPPGYAPEVTSGLEPHLTCQALDESDLVLTGQARSPWWSRQFRVVSSVAAVYRSPADARASWARGTSGAGLRCLRDALARSIGQGASLNATLRGRPFPRLAERTRAYRITLTSAGQTTTPPVTVDWILLGTRRANAGLVFVSVLQPPEPDVQRALAGTVARRMKSAMRGV